MDLNGVNLNLLLALDALLIETHVGRAARRMGVTQSAMSHQLRQLREIFGDPLLVRRGQRMVPTPRAQALAPELTDGLARLRRVVRGHQAFDPAETTETFVLATYDGVAVGLRKTFGRFRREAPRARLSIVPPPRDLTDALALGHVHAAIVPPIDVASGLESIAFAPTPWAVIFRRGLDVDPLDLDRYCELPHAMMSLSGRGPGVMDHFLAKLGRTREVVLRVPYLMLLPPLLEQIDCLATVPGPMVEYACARWALDHRPVPAPTPKLPTLLMWHARFTADPAHTWFRTLILEDPDFRALGPVEG